jgi:pyruvate,water dikinase
VQGMVTPDEFIVFKPLLDQAGQDPILTKKLGRKDKKMIYSVGGVGTTKIVDTSLKKRPIFACPTKRSSNWHAGASIIEKHYQKPMDIEWAQDGESGELFIVQARPETVQSRKTVEMLKSYTLTDEGKPIVTGLSIGDSIVTGRVWPH